MRTRLEAEADSTDKRTLGFRRALHARRLKAVVRWRRGIGGALSWSSDAGRKRLDGEREIGHVRPSELQTTYDLLLKKFAPAFIFVASPHSRCTDALKPQ